MRQFRQEFRMAGMRETSGRQCRLRDWVGDQRCNSSGNDVSRRFLDGLDDGCGIGCIGTARDRCDGTANRDHREYSWLHGTIMARVADLDHRDRQLQQGRAGRDSLGVAVKNEPRQATAIGPGQGRERDIEPDAGWIAHADGQWKRTAWHHSSLGVEGKVQGPATRAVQVTYIR